MNLIIEIAYWWLVSVSISMLLTWVLFGTVMRLREVKDSGNLTFRKRPVNFVLGYLALFVGALLDIFDNFAFFSVIGLEFPKFEVRTDLRTFLKESEWLSTARMCRWYPAEDDRLISRWRAGVARFFGEQILDDLDPDGNHIH